MMLLVTADGNSIIFIILSAPTFTLNRDGHVRIIILFHMHIQFSVTLARLYVCLFSLYECLSCTNPASWLPESKKMLRYVMLSLHLLGLCSRYIKPSLPQHPAQQIWSPRRARQRPTRPTALPSLLPWRRRRQNIPQLERWQHVQLTAMQLVLRVVAVAAVLRRRWHNSQAYRLSRRFPMDTGTADDSAILINNTNHAITYATYPLLRRFCTVLFFCFSVWFSDRKISPLLLPRIFIHRANMVDSNKLYINQIKSKQ